MVAPAARALPSASGARAMLTRGLPPDTPFSMAVDEDGCGHIILGDGKGAFSAISEFNLNRGGAMIKSVAVARQGEGTARTIMRNQFSFFISNGLSHFDIEAGREAGGHAWSRFGFLPSAMDGEKFEQRTRQSVKACYQGIEPLLDTAERRALSGTVRLRKPEDMWHLADAPVDLGPRLRTIFNPAAGNVEAARLEGIEQAWRSCGRTRILDDIRRRVNAGRPMPVGRLLQSGTSWEGYLDFGNARQAARATAYVGGLHPEAI